MRKRVAVVVLCGFALLLFAQVAEAVVLRVVRVETADAVAYAKEVMKGQEILKHLGSNATIRVWRARFAGPETGAVIVSVEYADMATLAKDEAKAMADPEYQAWMAGLNKMRKILSDSTYDELGR